MMRIDDFAYKQSAAQMQRWVWINLGASVSPDAFSLSKKKSDIFYDAVETVAQSVRSACTRPFLMPPQRCFEQARKAGDNASTSKNLTRCEQACWIGSAVVASVVGLAVHLVGVTLGVAVGAYRATLGVPDRSKARAYYARERDIWRVREDEASIALQAEMALQRDALPASLQAAAAELGEAVSQPSRHALHALKDKWQKLPEIVEPHDAGPFLGVAVGALSPLQEQLMGPHLNIGDRIKRAKDATRNADETLEKLTKLNTSYHDACIRRSAAERAITRI